MALEVMRIALILEQPLQELLILVVAVVGLIMEILAPAAPVLSLSVTPVQHLLPQQMPRFYPLAQMKTLANLLMVFLLPIAIVVL